MEAEEKEDEQPEEMSEPSSGADEQEAEEESGDDIGNFRSILKTIYWNRVLIIAGIVFIAFAGYIVIGDFGDKPFSKTIIPPTPSPIISPTPQPTNMPAQIYIMPTQALSATPSSSPTPTTTPALPTSTPEPTMRPPIMNITYPTEGQSITMNSSQTLCVVDSPGSNTTGLQKKENINNAGWTSYKDSYTTCISNPNEGDNTIQLQYRNKDAESQIYTIHFTFHRSS